MATPVIGTLPKFNPDVDTITTFLERIDLYFSANSMANAKRVPALLTTIYTLQCNLFAPEAPKDKSLANITAALTRHFGPTRSVIAERFHFHRRNQTAPETIAEYLAALRQAALHCSFDAFLEEALRDRLVGGLRTEAVQKRIQSEADLTSANAVKIAQGMEQADRNTRSLIDADPVIRQLTLESYWLEEATIHCLTVGSRRLNAMLVSRKETTLPFACPSPCPRTGGTPRSSKTLMVQEDQRQNDSDPEEFYLYKLNRWFAQSVVKQSPLNCNKTPDYKAALNR